MIKSVLQISRSRNSFIVGLVSLLASASQILAAEGGALDTSRALTLRDCISLALGESPELEASRLEVAEATEAARAQRDEMLPQIKGQYGATWFAGSPTSKFSVVNESGIAVTSNN